MVGMLVRPSSLAQAAPPGARAALPPAAPPPALQVQDDVEIRESAGPSVAGRALLGAMGLLALAGPAWAGTPGPVAAASAPVAVQSRVLPDSTPQPPPSGPLKLPSRDGTRFDFAYVNDSFKDPWGVAGQRDRQPGTQYTDDNGWTAEVRGDWIRTLGDQQTVVSGRLQMLTERGSWEPGAEYGGRRTDIVELAWQRNQRQALDGRTSLHYGYGGGVQAVGPLGGRGVQEAWHRHAPFGGRIGEEEGLQYNYTTERPTFAPLVTGGVGVVRQLDAQGEWEARGTLQGAVPLGQGLGVVRAEAGLRGYPSARLSVDAGVNVTGAYTTGRALDFMEIDGVRPGAHAALEYRLTEHVRPFARVDFGGVRDEPVYTVGFSIPFGGGGGERARLDPLWR